jgi:hypothetical protein
LTESIHATEEVTRRALRLDPADFDYVPTRKDCVVALSAVPTRLPYLKAVLAHLMQQTIAGVGIELHIPQRVRSTGDDWPPPPAWLLGLRSVRIVRHELDPGPSLKYLGPLRRRRESDPLIVVVDDDVLYPRGMIEALMQAEATREHTVFCCRGWNIHPTLSWDRSVLLTAEPGRLKPVAIATAHGGYALRRSFVEVDLLEDLADAPDECRMMDDVWLSGHLSRWGIPKLLVDSPPRYRLMIPTALGGDRARRNDVAIHYFGAAWRPEELDVDAVMGGTVA